MNGYIYMYMLCDACIAHALLSCISFIIFVTCYYVYGTSLCISDSNDIVKHAHIHIV